MQKRKRWLRILAPLVLLLGLACGPCNLLSNNKPTPPHAIAVSTESAAQLESRIRQNLTGVPGEQFILRMTDVEVTSLVATKLDTYAEPPLADPQIWFTNGKIYTTGRLVNVLPIKADLYIVSSACIADGKVALVVEKASAGSVPVPDGLLDTISQSVNETVDELQLELQVTALEILEGEIIVQGVRE
ncbi:MAG: hypothetical protein ACP5JJ_07230 [Anaerolineae bacterium]